MSFFIDVNGQCPSALFAAENTLIALTGENRNNPGMKPSPQDITAPTLPASLSSDDQRYIHLAAKFLREQGARKVWLFGSLAKGRRPTVHSDFDFAVEGLPSDRLFGSVGHLLQILPRPVDIVEFETCSTLLREQILEHGIVL